MLFHTWPFLLFFLVVWVGYLGLRNSRYWIHWLLAASYFFYGWWNPLYLLLIVYSTLLDYFAVQWMDGSRRRRLWLWVSVCNNLFLLGFFKYAEFVTDNLNLLLGRLDLGYELAAPGVLLPVGISFYTFQSMSYTIDFYRGEIPRERSLVRFAAFVSLFPQLVAGPIERAKELLPQLERFPAITVKDVADGASLFVVGLFKKVALADYLAGYVDPVYSTPDRFDGPELVLATFAFAWQIYFDFSGYTDMARGIGRAMGVRLMLNFRNPYLATSLRDFWARWHISLSSWFRDYTYIPLGGSRRGGWFTYRNLVLTMVISGLWHGAAWQFVIWGGIHALGVVLTRRLDQTEWYRESIPTIAKQLFVFTIVCFAWVFFRALSVADAWLILARIGQWLWTDPRFPVLAMALVAAVWAYQWFFESRAVRVLRVRPVRIGLVAAMILYLMVVPGTGQKAFIYFAF